MPATEKARVQSAATISAEKLEELFHEDEVCEWVVLFTQCGQPASHVWIFDPQCDCAKTHNYMCSAHNLSARAKGMDLKPWTCRYCGTTSELKEIRRIK